MTSLLGVLAGQRSSGQSPTPPAPVDPFPTGPTGDPEEGIQFLSNGAGPNFATPPAGAAVPTYDRALGWYFTGEDVIISWTDGADLTGWELRNYEGQVVKSGTNPTSPLNLGRPGIGWYKLYLRRGTDVGNPWGRSGGETTFIVSSTNAGLRATPVPVGQEGEGWVTSANRAYIGTGLVRVDVDIKDADRASWRASLDHAKTEAARAMTNLAAMADEPGTDNQRLVFVQFPDGEATGGPNPTTEQQYQITTTVQEMCALGVTHFEGRNEPVTGGRNGSTTAAEYAAFAPIVHAAHPDAKVGGPCPVNINPKNDGTGWFRDFLAAGGGDHLDFITFHPYNATNNDANQGKRVYQGFVALLTEFGQQNKPRWMTEYGHYAWVNSSFEPRWQAQVMMAEGILLWQHGVHRNHVMHYYDYNVGYWAQPMFMWTHDRGRKCPAPLPLMWRTWVEETWGMDHDAALDFGPVENRHWIGSRYQHADGRQCLTIMGTGRYGTVTLTVTGATQVVVADYFGRTTAVPVTAGRASVPVGPEPTHVRVPAGVTATVVPKNYGSDVTPRATLTTVGSTGGNGPAKVVDGVLNNWYETQAAGTEEWRATPGDSGPAWWRMDFAAPVTFDRVEVVCPPPWQQQGSLLDFDVHALVNGTWQVIYTKTIDPVSVDWTSDKAVGGSWVDSFWSRERIFLAELAQPVTATSIRVYARDMSFGGGASIDQARTLKKLDTNGKPTTIGQAGRKRMTLQEVALYKS